MIQSCMQLVVLLRNIMLGIMDNAVLNTADGDPLGVKNGIKFDTRHHNELAVR